jgi:protein-tyrosine phosphatase
LQAGRLVVFPTETFYGVAASALSPEAVARLGPDAAPTLAVRDAAAALDWAPDLGALGRRLARRCWPGPVTLVFGNGVAHGLASRLPEAVRQQLCPGGELSLRAPAHEAVLQALYHLPWPLVLTSVRGADGPAATAEQALRAVGEAADLVIDDGPSAYRQEATVVRVDGAAWDIVREGVVPADVLEQLAPCRVVFVCTGNTCRSPLAEALCKKVLADRLGCTPAELPRRGFQVLSAGLSAMMGGAAAAEAIAVAEELGADLSAHQSRPVTADLLAQVDCVVAMTRGHLRALAADAARLGARLRLLCPDGSDIEDPIGGDADVYRACAGAILRHLEELVSELQQE